MISVHFQGKPFNITVIQVYAPTSNAEEAEVKWFYEDSQDLFQTNTPKRCPFHYRGLECKSRNSRNTGVTGKLGLGVQNEAGQRLWHSQGKSRCFSRTLLLFNDPMDIGNLISGSSAFSKSSLNIWNG